MNNEVITGIKEYILGGKAEFTIFQEPNIQVKYKVEKSKESKVFYVTTEVSDSIKAMSYQGYFINKEPYTFQVGKKGTPLFNERAIKALFWVLYHANNMPKKVHVLHNGRCSVCGRKLTDADSLMCGVGPTCRKKVGL